MISLPILAAGRLADWESADLPRPGGSLCRFLRWNPPGAPCGKSAIDEGQTVGATIRFAFPDSIFWTGPDPNGAYLRGFLDDFPRPAARRPRDRIE